MSVAAQARDGERGLDAGLRGLPVEADRLEASDGITGLFRRAGPRRRGATEQGLHLTTDTRCVAVFKIGAHGEAARWP